VHAAGYRMKADQTPILPLGDDQVIVNAAMAQPQVVRPHAASGSGGLASSKEGLSLLASLVSSLRKK